MAERSVASTQQVFDSLVKLFVDARRYDAKPLNAAYASSVMRLGIKLATERRLAQELPQETQAKLSGPKEDPSIGSSA